MLNMLFCISESAVSHFFDSDFTIVMENNTFKVSETLCMYDGN